METAKTTHMDTGDTNAKKNLIIAIIKGIGIAFPRPQGLVPRFHLNKRAETPANFAEVWNEYHWIYYVEFNVIFYYESGLSG